MTSIRPPGLVQKHLMDDGAEIDCYHASAVGKRKGGLVLVQEIFGLTPHIREQCDRFADAGYDVIAPAIFDRQAPGLDLGYGAAEVEEAIRLVRSHAVERAVADAAGCVDLLRNDGPVFMTGYCYGGSVTWLAACRPLGLTAAACYYGSMIPARSALTPRCPTLVHFGREDTEIPMSEVEAFIATRPDVDVQLYAAGHGFNSDRRSDYHADSAALAFRRTTGFFEQHGG